MLKISLSGKYIDLSYHQKNNEDSLAIKDFSSIFLTTSFFLKKKKKITACGFMEIYFLKQLLCIIIVFSYIACNVPHLLIPKLSMLKYGRKGAISGVVCMLSELF